MSEHEGALLNISQQATASTAQSTVAVNANPARWIKTDDGRYRWWNGEHWTDYYVAIPNPDAAQISAARDAVEDFPPRWRQQPDGRFRWWSGSAWQDDYTRDPSGEIEYAQQSQAIESSAAPAVTAASQLKELAELHVSGILTDDEFAAAKKKILGI